MGFAADSPGSAMSADQELNLAPTFVGPHPRHRLRSLHDRWYITGTQHHHDEQFHLVDNDFDPAPHHHDPAAGHDHDPTRTPGHGLEQLRRSGSGTEDGRRNGQRDSVRSPHRSTGIELHSPGRSGSTVHRGLLVGTVADQLLRHPVRRPRSVARHTGHKHGIMGVGSHELPDPVASVWRVSLAAAVVLLITLAVTIGGAF